MRVAHPVKVAVAPCPWVGWIRMAQREFTNHSMNELACHSHSTRSRLCVSSGAMSVIGSYDHSVPIYAYGGKPVKAPCGWGITGIPPASGPR